MVHSIDRHCDLWGTYLNNLIDRDSVFWKKSELVSHIMVIEDSFVVYQSFHPSINVNAMSFHSVPIFAALCLMIENTESLSIKSIR